MECFYVLKRGNQEGIRILPPIEPALCIRIQPRLLSVCEDGTSQEKCWKKGWKSTETKTSEYETLEENRFRTSSFFHPSPDFKRCQVRKLVSLKRSLSFQHHGGITLAFSLLKFFCEESSPFFKAGFIQKGEHILFICFYSGLIEGIYT